MTAIEQLLRDAMTTHTDDVPHLRPGTARTVLRRSHRATRVRLAAASTATVAATVGVGATAVALQPRTSATVGAGSGPAPVSASAATTADPQASDTPAGAPTPLAPVTLYGAKLDGTPPPVLSPIAMRDAVPGFTLRSVETTQASMGSRGVLWVKLFAYSRLGSSFNDVTVTVVDGLDHPVRNPSSPAPTTSPVSVLGHPATDWTSGGDHEVYFTAGSLAVEIFSDSTSTAAQLVAIGNALTGLPE